MTRKRTLREKLDLSRYIVDKEFQYSYIIRSLILLFFVMLSTFIIIIAWNKFRFYQGYMLNPPPAEQVVAWAEANNVKTDSPEFAFQFIAQAKPYTFYNIIIWPVLLVFFVNMLVVALASLYISYKIAGPLYRLKSDIRKKIETGDFEKPLHVRKEDPFHELTSLANFAFTVALHPEIKRFIKEKQPESDKALPESSEK